MMITSRSTLDRCFPPTITFFRKCLQGSCITSGNNIKYDGASWTARRKLHTDSYCMNDGVLLFGHMIAKINIIGLWSLHHLVDER